MLVNTLKSILPNIIDESQNAFVPGRMIFDNIMVAHETIHAMNSCKHGKTGYLETKLNISKAYDRIEWPYLERVRKTMGFLNKWISRVMCCVTTVTYSVMVNGKQCGNILPSRGIR